MFRELMKFKYKLIQKTQYISIFDLSSINNELDEIEWNDKNTKIFLNTLKFIFEQDSSILNTFILKLKKDTIFYSLFVKEFIKDKYPILNLLVNKKVVLYGNLIPNSFSSNLILSKSLNINDYLKKEFKISSKAIANWLGKNLINDKKLESIYLTYLYILSSKIKTKNRNEIILDLLNKIKNRGLPKRAVLLQKQDLNALLKLTSIKQLTPWKTILLLQEDNYLLDVIRMTHSIIDLNLQDNTIIRKNLSLKTLHDNLTSILKNKKTFNFKIKKGNLISSSKINKYNKRSSKWEFKIPRTNREVYKWGECLGHCIGTAKYAHKFKRDKIVILGVYKENKLKYALDISTNNKKSLHTSPGKLNHIEGKSGIPNEEIYNDIKKELINIGIINDL